MSSSKVTIPKFKTEDEEVAWWDAHREIAAEIMPRAVKAGTARHGPLRTVTIRLPESDIAVAHALAQKRALPYQTYIKMLLHEAIEKERRSA